MYKILPRSSGAIFVSLKRKFYKPPRLKLKKLLEPGFVFKSEQLSRDLDTPSFNFNKRLNLNRWMTMKGNPKKSDNNCR